MARSHYITDDKETFHVNLARLKKGGSHFEIAINSEEAIAFKEGKDVSIKDIMQSEHIYFDVRKGELASEERLKTLFGTNDPLKIAEIILKEGEVQLTQEQREEARERKRKKIIALIAREAIDPKTKLPHPPERVRLAMEEAKVTINEFRTAEQQIDDVVKKLKPILPISFEKRTIEIRVPANFAGKIQSFARQQGKIVHESWLNDGSFQYTVELSGGLVDNYIEKLNNVTHGSVEVKEIK
ncbi:ribosome assembly factor SBDS [Candidatus Woesearchaeota archaeon]|nr:ribosome assembly factor SBDS [Candidatus Woesearchaeota archaeon]MBW3018179.1 ribosome assembly factor SBDS [Candidatus Woesearchaeota archaeon]